jgi:hypothetical protein
MRSLQVGRQTTQTDRPHVGWEWVKYDASLPSVQITAIDQHTLGRLLTTAKAKYALHRQNVYHSETIY